MRDRQVGRGNFLGDVEKIGNKGERKKKSELSERKRECVTPRE